MKRALIALLASLNFSLGLAHSELTGSEPAAWASLSAAPSEIVLNFSEPVEVAFSIFKVYRLDTDTTLTPPASPDESAHEHAAAPAARSPEQLRLNGLAAALVSDVLQTEGDEEARVDRGILESGQSDRVTLSLREGLEPGTYVVMWRALSVDTHTIQGYYLFELKPGN